MSDGLLKTTVPRKASFCLVHGYTVDVVSVVVDVEVCVEVRVVVGEVKSEIKLVAVIVPVLRAKEKSAKLALK